MAHHWLQIQCATNQRNARIFRGSLAFLDSGEPYDESQFKTWRKPARCEPKRGSVSWSAFLESCRTLYMISAWFCRSVILVVSGTLFRSELHGRHTSGVLRGRSWLCVVHRVSESTSQVKESRTTCRSTPSAKRKQSWLLGLPLCVTKNVFCKFWPLPQKTQIYKIGINIYTNKQRNWKHI